MEQTIEIKIQRYREQDEAAWDRFVFSGSVNGTFLQSRRFLNYHPKDRFTDHSLLFFLKGKLIAVCPACEIQDPEGRKSFVSHMGSTYGGLVVSREALRLEIACAAIQFLDQYLKARQFLAAELKPTMSLLCREPDEAYLFALRMNGYQEYQELNLYIDYSSYDRENIPGNFSKLKKRQVHQCIAKGFELRELTNRGDTEVFHAILSENLEKFHRKPVHTVDEILDLKSRFPEEIHLFGAFLEDEMLSGTMVFEFPDAGCAHTQYLAAKRAEGSASPMSFIYDSMIRRYAEKNYRTLSWGIATEHYGAGVNWGLMRNKEEFGSRHCVIPVYGKTF